MTPRISSRVRLHRVCLGNEDNGKFKTWRGLHELTGIKTAPTFLKMDIEGFEFPAMQAMIDAGYLLPLQIAMELHIADRKEPPGPVFARDKIVGSGELLTFMNYMHNFGGYYLVDRNDNPNCRYCTEILLAKLDCANHPINENSYQNLRKQTYPIFTKAVQKTLDEKYYSV